MEIKIQTTPELEGLILGYKIANRLGSAKKTAINIIQQYFQLSKDVEILKREVQKKESELRYYNDLFNRIRDAKKAQEEIQRITGIDV